MSEEKLADLVEGLCGVMHDAYEAAAAKAGWETQERSRKPWADVPDANKVTMRAAVAAAVDALTFMGWVSPEEAKAREAAARREALLEAAEEHRAEIDAERRAWVTADKRAGFQQERAEKAEAKVARVEALAEEWSIPAVVDGFDATADFADAIHNDGPWRFARDFRAALAEPERDEEDGR